MPPEVQPHIHELLMLAKVSPPSLRDRLKTLGLKTGLRLLVEADCVRRVKLEEATACVVRQLEEAEACLETGAAELDVINLLAPFTGSAKEARLRTTALSTSIQELHEKLDRVAHYIDKVEDTMTRAAAASICSALRTTLDQELGLRLAEVVQALPTMQMGLLQDLIVAKSDQSLPSSPAEPTGQEESEVLEGVMQIFAPLQRLGFDLLALSRIAKSDHGSLVAELRPYGLRMGQRVRIEHALLTADPAVLEAAQGASAPTHPELVLPKPNSNLLLEAGRFSPVKVGGSSPEPQQLPPPTPPPTQTHPPPSPSPTPLLPPASPLLQSASPPDLVAHPSQFVPPPLPAPLMPPSVRPPFSVPPPLPLPRRYPLPEEEEYEIGRIGETEDRIRSCPAGEMTATLYQCRYTTTLYQCSYQCTLHSAYYLLLLTYDVTTHYLLLHLLLSSEYSEMSSEY